jgi:hypothetical protein
MKGTVTTGGKGLIRSLNRRGSKSGKAVPVVLKRRAYRDPSICDACGAVYTAKTWRQARRLPRETLDRAAYVKCPACDQVAQGEYYGRVLISGPFVAKNLDAIRARIANVERRARVTQPERRTVSEDWDGSTLEVLTTSQKLAHRVAHELEKAFGGRAKYTWSDDDGALLTSWTR